MILKNAMSSTTKIFLVLCNIIALIATLNFIDITLPAEVEAHVEVQPPHEAMIPHITISDEMKVGMFFERLRVDHSKIDPKGIMQSIQPWEPFIQRYSGEYGVDPDLVRAIIYAESKGDPYSISKDGAMGLMQIMPSTADFLGISDMLEPEMNIKAGVMYISWLVKHYNEDHVLWAWNAGPGMLRKHRMPGETKKFIVEVISVRTFLKNDENKMI